jgi:hypothetical protein
VAEQLEELRADWSKLSSGFFMLQQSDRPANSVPGATDTRIVIVAGGPVLVNMEHVATMSGQGGDKIVLTMQSGAILAVNKSDWFDGLARTLTKENPHAPKRLRL